MNDILRNTISELRTKLLCDYGCEAYKQVSGDKFLTNVPNELLDLWRGKDEPEEFKAWSPTSFDDLSDICSKKSHLSMYRTHDNLINDIHIICELIYSAENIFSKIKNKKDGKYYEN